MFDYTTGLTDGMLIQAAEQKEQNTELIVRAMRLAEELIKEEDFETLERCYQEPDRIEYYCNVYGV